MRDSFDNPTIIKWANPHSQCRQLKCPVTLETKIWIDGICISDWLQDNGIKRYTFWPQTESPTSYAMILYFAFENEADATLFALRWS